MRELSAADVARRRVAAQRVEPEGGARLDPADVVRHLGAVQAQDYVQSLWAIGLRAGASARAEDVEQASTDGTIVRSWGMRGTLHWTAAEDSDWMHALFAPGVLARTTERAWAYHAVDRAMADRTATLLEHALASGPKSRKELSSLLVEHGVADDKQQHYFLYAHLSHAGLLRHGPRQDGVDTLALRSVGLPPQRRLDHDEAVSELARRFFRSHGPATVADFTHWSGLTAAETGPAVDRIRGNLEEGVRDGRVHLFVDIPPADSRVHLLPAYDELLIGLDDRRAHFATYGEVAIATYNGMFRATVVDDGQVVGTWRRERQRTRMKVETRLVPELPAARYEQVEGAAARYAAFHDQSTTVVDAGPPPRESGRAPWASPSR